LGDSRKNETRGDALVSECVRVTRCFTFDHAIFVAPPVVAVALEITPSSARGSRMSSAALRDRSFL
jgi:hypothetical protein